MYLLYSGVHTPGRPLARILSAVSPAPVLLFKPLP